MVDLLDGQRKRAERNWRKAFSRNRLCECCGIRSGDVYVSEPHPEYSETLLCEGCYIEVFGRADMPREDLS
jgi:hypothetical protein